ncbi:hypothetical protein MUN82_12415 [Hymenobacter aerilatus]|uniref:STAS/SEC14 domain-containing protein n=1 Tax=Hymenobacter aerilatus TaxID=2932251 RepID=A0A8T9SU60_9BACT|nr:hypothetical protein [Hymenobacter aerilatus]UOR03750.1 hypothetical protein MUN82_12415 [Hymenobacter aerilatus]
MKQVFSTPSVTIYLHEGLHHTIEVQWLDFVNSETLRSCLLEALRLVRQHRVRAWIADNRLLRAIRTKDFEWMDSHIMQPLDQLQVHRLAVIDSLDGMNQLGIKLFLSSIIPNTNIVTQTFTSAETARAWATLPY